MPVKFNADAYKFEDGTYMAHVFPGGYPVYYITEGEVLCPKCVNDNLGNDSFTPEQADVNWEDESGTLRCVQCDEAIPSAYGED